jgi:Methionyl-tRNA formyltransferase
MKILLITTAFNGMAQRTWVELDRLDHQVKVHIAGNEKKLINVVYDYKPDLIIAPYLKTVIPEKIWKEFTCLIVHPGIPGDRGASSLDWAILNNEKEWGVTILQATGKMDAGPVWAYATFRMRNVSKSFLYRHEITEAAMEALLKAVQKFQDKNFIPQNLHEMNGLAKGRWNRSTCINDFKIDWNTDTDSVLRKINAADSNPGALCEILGQEYFCYGAYEEDGVRGEPGELLAQHHHAICIATKDAALWIQCLKKNEAGAIKLPATIALEKIAMNVPVSLKPVLDERASKTFRDIRYQEENEVGYLCFDFYNGAMDTDQCRRLKQAFIEAKHRKTKVIVLMGGEDIWCNGIHLNVIEGSADPAETSWENINAIDDLIREIICTDTHYIISAMHGNAGGGGVTLALAADKVVARTGIVFNPHTRNVGLYGSEYWTYLLPRRIGAQRAMLFTEQCLPWGTAIAMEVKLIDVCIPQRATAFREEVKRIAGEVAHLSWYPQLLKAKKFKRERDENYKSLQTYRDEELEKMAKNFFDDDWGYDFKRYCFVHKIKEDENINDVADKDLYSERRKIWRRRKYEKLFYET